MAHLDHIVTQSNDGRRVDALVRALLPALAPQDIRGVFARRDVKLDGLRVRADVRVRAGQRIDVYYIAPADPGLNVVYRDPDVLILNKRAGISVDVDGSGLPCLASLAAAAVSAEDPDAGAPVPCHRLDNQTCGLVVFALNPAAEAAVTAAFRDRTIRKHYQCLVKGRPKPPSAVCRAWLTKDARAARVSVSDRELPGSRPIVTGYETLKAGPVSRLRVHLITGRTHQIRAHMAALGHPLLGDDLYGDRAFNRAMKSQGRLMLCACSLAFPEDFPLPTLAGRSFAIPCPF